MKIVWLCHFVNTQMKEYFNTPNVKEMAPWINNLIDLFKNNTNIELHIVAPNVYNNTNHEVVVNNVYYHFYRHRPKYIPKKVHSFLKIKTRINIFFKQNIHRVILKIQPDLIHLHGAENPYYSAGILKFINKIPTLITIQGFNRNIYQTSSSIQKKIQLEEKIIKQAKHFGVRTKEMKKIILGLNQNALLHFHNYPLTIPQFIKQNNDEFDIVFFARVSRDKGIEDLLEALALVKTKKPDVSLHILGYVGNSYKQYLQNTIKLLHLEKNVKFLGFLQTQQNVFRYAIKAKICVLPTYHDIIPGTIIESMYMKLPVIAYAVGGIPELNEAHECIVLVEKQNIKKLAEEIIQLLNNIKKRDILAEQAYNYATETFNNNKVAIDILRAYNQILLYERN